MRLGAQGLGGSRRRTVVFVALGALLLYLLVRRDVLGPDSFLLLAVLVPSIILHEVSHGAVALAFGDDTAQKAGRLTLNPARHVDPIGTLVLPGVLVLVGAAPIGYAKPVPVRPARLRHPRNHGLLVSLAGPAVNIVIALVAALALSTVISSDLRLVLSTSSESVLPLYVRFGDPSLTERILFWLGYANVLLAAFNLIPIPPLDGSAVVERLLPAKWWPGYLRLRQYSMLILLAVVFLAPELITRVFAPALRAWEGLVA